jgi:hypothetical protein
MAENRGQQGTGRHPHKSGEEPWSHTKEEGAQHGKLHGGDGSRAQSHGGGHEGSHGGHGRPHEAQTQGHGSPGREHDRESEEDLKRREYRGEDGRIHHHTRSYMEQHGGHEERGGSSRSHDRDDDRPRDREHAQAGSDSRSHGRDNDRSDRRR